MLQGVIIGTKSLHPQDQTIFMNPMGTLALVTLFRPMVVQSANHVSDTNHVLTKTDIVDIIDIGKRDPVTKVFLNSILQQVVNDAIEDDSSQISIEHCEDSSNVLFLPLKNNNRLRKSMSI